MSKDDARSEFATIASLGGKIGIPILATPDFDLVYADANAIDNFCDQFESIDLSPKERFYFMQLIVASLDGALRATLPSALHAERRVEFLLLQHAAEYRYILDYWSRTGDGIELRVAPMMRRVMCRAV